VASAAAVELAAQWHDAAPKSAVDLCKGLFLSYAQAIAKDTAAKKASYVKMFDAVEAKVKEGGAFTEEDGAALKLRWALAPARKPRKPRAKAAAAVGGPAEAVGGAAEAVVAAVAAVLHQRKLHLNEGMALDFAELLAVDARHIEDEKDRAVNQG
jgi:hypothetical protein